MHLHHPLAATTHSWQMQVRCIRALLSGDLHLAVVSCQLSDASLLLC